MFVTTNSSSNSNSSCIGSSKQHYQNTSNASTTGSNDILVVFGLLLISVVVVVLQISKLDSHTSTNNNNNNHFIQYQNKLVTVVVESWWKLCCVGATNVQRIYHHRCSFYSRCHRHHRRLDQLLSFTSTPPKQQQQIRLMSTSKDDDDNNNDYNLNDNNNNNNNNSRLFSTNTRRQDRFISPRTVLPYDPPIWTKGILTKPPIHGRIQLANVPTPIYQIDNPIQIKRIIINNNNNKNDKIQSTILNSKITFWDILDKYNIKLYIKRDDTTGGIELGGNKVRKLEFLLADAIVTNCDTIVTIGGEQSNHCRATASASRILGLQPHLILRTSSTKNTKNTNNNKHYTIHDDTMKEETTNNNNDIGFIGNVLFDRMVGSTIYTCTIGEYGRFGSTELLNRLCTYLTTTGTNNNNNNVKPYPIPVGGSNALGTWGYIRAVDELFQQCHIPQSTTTTNDNTNTNEFPFDHIVFACGSGGTAAGIGLGIRLAYDYYYNINKQSNNNFHSHQKLQDHYQRPKVHAMGVCDDETYFYNHIKQIAIEMGYTSSSTSSSTTPPPPTIDELITESIQLHQAKGNGYAISTDEELNFIQQFAIDTGIVLDPVYTGKALYNFVQYIEQKANNDPSELINEFQNKSILFWHTGGALGLYEKVSDLVPEQQPSSTSSSSILTTSPCYRLDMYGKGTHQMGKDSIDLS